MTETAEIKKAKRSKRLVVRSLNQIKSELEAGLEENPSSDMLNQLTSQLESWKLKLQELKELDSLLLDDIDYTASTATTTKLEDEITADFSNFEKGLTIYRGKVKTISEVVNPPDKPRHSFLNASFLEASLTSPTVKIQDIPVPKFNGKIQNFPDWYNEFVSMIDKNEGLDNFQKLYLLKRAMIGDAENLLKDYSSEPDMYPLALKHIHEMYFNRRRIIAGYFSELLDLPVIKFDNLRESIEVIQRLLRGLKVCGIDTVKMSPLVTFIVSRKLPDRLRIDWENSNYDYSTYPSFEPMAIFLTNRCFAYETVKVNKRKIEHPVDGQGNGNYKSNDPKGAFSVGVKAGQSGQGQQSTIKCVVCGEAHYLNLCKQFAGKSVPDRFEIVKKNKLCLKCFNPYHTLAKCKRFNCSKCNENHHVMLHRERENTGLDSNLVEKTTPQVTPSDSDRSKLLSNVTSMCSSSNTKMVVLSTAVVKIVNSNNNVELARILIDGGSETSLVSRDFCRRARLNMFSNTDKVTLTGINGTSILSTSAKFLVKSRSSAFQIAIEANVIGRIPCQINSRSIIDITKHFTDINFAETCELPYNSVDILVGSEYAEFLFEDRRRFFEDICLRDSKFGYVISGSTKSSFVVQKQAYCGFTNVELDDQFKRFCQIEDVSEKVDFKTDVLLEHQMIREHFDSTFTRDDSGRFVLRLPTKPSIVNLKGSFNKAKTIFLKNEKRLSDVRREAYCNFMSEYENLCHMTKMNNVTEFMNDAYFIPHHMVTKITSTTTKDRVVFNASFKDESGMSLNDHLLDGPVNQPELFTHIIRFRRPVIALTADIAFMYRQILIHLDDRKYQCIIFRFLKHLKLDVFFLNTLTQGTKPASFMATYCLLKVAEFICETFPIASASIKSEFYMDNWMSGANTIEEAIELQRVVHETLADFGFPLRKYMSNSPELLAKIDRSFIEPLKSRVLGDDSFTYLLGLVWFPEPDTLSVMLHLVDLPDVITKRVMLSDISKIFDVLGMLCPVTIKAKILMQDLWRLSLGWDEPISSELEREFLAYRSNLLELNDFAIPRRYYLSSNIVSRQLLCFSDASIRAYSAVIYVRSVDNKGNVHVSFVCAKTRVAPLSAINIHRLELLAALLLSRLTDRVCNDLSFDRTNVFAFCDSQVTLSWINHPVEKLKQYVSNRVSKINSIISSDKWSYIDTKNNPADLATRGISARNFLNQRKTWIFGPEWSYNEFEYHVSSKFETSIDIPETCYPSVNVNVAKVEVAVSILNKFSSLGKCINVISYVLRFIRNVKDRKSKSNDIIGSNDNIIPSLTVEERNVAFNRIIHCAQIEHFQNEYFALSANQLISDRSKLYSLNVILTADNLLRVGGRLSASNFSFDTKYPIILDRRSRLIELYIIYVHERFFHSSISFVLNFIRSKFRVVGGLATLIKKIIRNCVLCTRFNAKFVEQFMADLPIERTTISRPFSTVGVDFSGAFNVKCVNHRSTKYNKVYICFFVCFVTRAVHIELVEDLTTEAFISALERFIGRRGLPAIIYSDNATNFVGTRNVLERAKLLNYSNNQSISWRFISPRSPHQGGLWEAAVKAGKICLVKAIGSQILNFSEFNTILVKVESILNSRPLAYRNVNEFVEPLTPAHLLIGGGLYESPIVDDNSIKLKSRFKLWRSIVDSFWNDWRHDYLHQLQTRYKWQEKIRNLKVDDVVLFVEQNESVMNWPLGRIVSIYPDKNGIVRNVDVQTRDGVFCRSVQKLMLLPVNN